MDKRRIPMMGWSRKLVVVSTTCILTFAPMQPVFAEEATSGAPEVVEVTEEASQQSESDAQMQAQEQTEGDAQEQATEGNDQATGSQEQTKVDTQSDVKPLLEKGTIGNCAWQFDSTTGTITISKGSGTTLTNELKPQSEWASYGNSDKITSIKIADKVVAGESLACLFKDLKNLTTIEGLDNIDTSAANASSLTSMAQMFENCESLTSLDLSSFDMTARTASTDKDAEKHSPVTTAMFKGCKALAEVTLGTNVLFPDDPVFPAPAGTEYTGLWGSSTGDACNAESLNSKYATISPSSTITWKWQKAFPTTTISISENEITYDGKAHTPEEVTVKFGDTTLVLDTDYTVPSDVSLTDVGSVEFEITGKGYYGGTYTATLAVTPRPVTVTPVASPTTKVYDAYKYSTLRVEPELSVTVKDSDGKTWDATPKGTIAVKNSSDKTVSGLASASVGTYSLVVTLSEDGDELETASYDDGNYTFTAGDAVSFKVTPASIDPDDNEDSNITLATTMTYTGKALEPKPVIKMYSTVEAEDSDDGQKHVYSATLTENTDYTLAYSDNTNAGTGKVTITGKGNYTGTVTKTFTIKKSTTSNTSRTTTTTTKRSATPATADPTVSVSALASISAALAGFGITLRKRK